MRIRRSRRQLSTPQHRAVRIQREVSAAVFALAQGDADQVEHHLDVIRTYARAIELTADGVDPAVIAVAVHGSTR